MMTTATRLRILSHLELLFPIRALRWKASVIYHAFDDDLVKARTSSADTTLIEHNRQFEVSEYEDQIRSIQSNKLINEAERLFIYIEDLQWERGNYGRRYLDRLSLSKLHHAVREQKDKKNEFYLKLAGACIGIVGALIGLTAMLKK